MTWIQVNLPPVGVDGSGVTFGPTKSDRMYLSRNDHRATSRDHRRNKWSRACPPPCEFEVFWNADSHAWADENNHLWGIRPDLPELGSGGERMAKFPKPTNDNDAWHGYPVSARDYKREFEHQPPVAVVEQWKRAELVDDVQAARINRRKV